MNIGLKKIINMTISEYIQIKEIRKNTTAMLSDGKWYRLHMGRWITEEQFNEELPPPIYLGNYKKNPDSRKFYLE